MLFDAYDANPFRYCGYQFDKETGFYYLKYRYYVPSLGRFLTRDSMMTGNRYVYCRNNPVNFVDYLGLAPIVDDYIIQLPNKKIIDTRTGEVYRKSYIEQNRELIGSVISNSIQGSGDFLVGKLVIDSLKEYRYIFKPNYYGNGLPTLAGSVPKASTIAFKTTAKALGVLSAAAYFLELRTDMLRYEGEERSGAIALTTLGFAATTIASLAIAAFGAPAWITFSIGVAVGVTVGTFIENEKLSRYGND